MRRVVVPVFAVIAGVGVTCGAIVAGGLVPAGGSSDEPGTLNISPHTGSAWQVFRQQTAAAPSDVIVPPKPVPAMRPKKVAEASGQPQVFVAKPVRPVARAAPPDAVAPDRVTLARALQRELKRVGCYHGEINGVWTPATRHASEAFLALANARLPVGEPDPVLLALVQGNQSTSCTVRREDTFAANAHPSKTAATVAVQPPPAALSPPPTPATASFDPPMALNGPPAAAGPATSAVPTAPVAEQKSPQARPAAKQRSVYRAPRNDWRMKVWRGAAN